jgi:hypothetical protein
MLVNLVLISMISIGFSQLFYFGVSRLAIGT